MRHHKAQRTLSRTKRGRAALLKSLARSLVLHESIVTTVAKAKELRPFMEKLVTKGKERTLASRRVVLSRIGSPAATRKIDDALAKRYEKRQGGYTRIIRLGRVGKRTGESARIEFVR